MPLATPAEYRALLDSALAGGYAVAAVNVTSSQTLNAALRGFAEAEADGIVQITTSGGGYASGSVGDMALGAMAIAGYAREVANRYPVLVALHTDHCTVDHLDGFVRPLLAESRKRRERGEAPVFHSHMFDGSTLPLSENLRVARSLLDECRSLEVLLEIEIGVVGGEEDGVVGGDPDERLYTSTADALAVAEALGTGERGRYLLSATFGNVHGHYRPGHVKLRPELLGELQQVLADRYLGARFQFVFHGGSGSEDAEIAEAVEHGVVKMNVDTDAQYAFTRAAAGHMFENYADVLKVDDGVGDKRAYDPRSWGRRAEAAMAAAVADVCHRLGSAGRSLGSPVSSARSPMPAQQAPVPPRRVPPRRPSARHLAS